MCISEVFALRCEDIDFKKNTISIRSQYILGRILEYTKTKQIKTIIPIWDMILRFLTGYTVEKTVKKNIKCSSKRS